MKKRTRYFFPPFIILAAALLLATVPMAFVKPSVFFIMLGVAVVIIVVIVALYMKHSTKGLTQLINSVAESINEENTQALEVFPLPIMVSSEDGEVLWYNELFQNDVVGKGKQVIGQESNDFLGGLAVSDIANNKGSDIVYDNKRYDVYTNNISVKNEKINVFYYLENTELKKIADEYTLSRPAVMLIYADNMEELLADARDSEWAQLSGRVETILEDWAANCKGLLRKYSNERFLMVLEQKALQSAIDDKFEILEKARSITLEENRYVTLSIGVGTGDNIRESEQMARQALDMALGRGGDQVAVRTKNGYDFYGGLSQGVEKRTKVRTRVVASALKELIENSGNVFVMGHSFSDFDSLGSSAAFTSVIRALGKPAWTVLRKETTMAPELLDRYIEAGRQEQFVEPEEALEKSDENSFLIITDTHNPKILESAELYEKLDNVVVIDHHRKMVDHIDDAVIFYHEPYASSASELVTELIQYMGNHTLARVDAEALLSGIMLDTRDFVMRSGVRTFEAAAYLRRYGADTVEVKRLFSGSMDLFREKSDIIARAEMHGKTAISTSEETGGSQKRIAAAQAANELLYIKGVDASFVLFIENDVVNISARSLGSFNVQLVMEAMGGGGHLTMAGAQFPGKSIKDVHGELLTAIQRYQTDRARAVAMGSIDAPVIMDGPIDAPPDIDNLTSAR